MTPTTEPEPERYFVVLTRDGQTARVRADMACDHLRTKHGLKLKRNGEVVACFLKPFEVTAWWVDEVGVSGPRHSFKVQGAVIEVASDSFEFEAADCVFALLNGQKTAAIYSEVSAWWRNP